MHLITGIIVTSFARKDSPVPNSRHALEMLGTQTLLPCRPLPSVQHGTRLAAPQPGSHAVLQHRRRRGQPARAVAATGPGRSAATGAGGSLGGIDALPRSPLERYLQEQGVSAVAAALLALQYERLGGTADFRQDLAPKFELFRRHSSAEPDGAQVLAKCLQASPEGAALTLLPPAFEAALQFGAAQLQRVSRRHFERLHHPYSLYRFMKLHPDLAGGLLAQHPAPFQQHAAPWLRRQLGWGDAALADAALSRWLPDLCLLDAQQAQLCVDWLLQLGLSRQQAGELLRSDVRLLADPTWQLPAVQRRVGELAAAWRVPAHLAAALVLSQPWLTGGMADRTGQLVQTLQVREAGGHACGRPAEVQAFFGPGQGSVSTERACLPDVRHAAPRWHAAGHRGHERGAGAAVCAGRRPRRRQLHAHRRGRGAGHGPSQAAAAGEAAGPGRPAGGPRGEAPV